MRTIMQAAEIENRTDGSALPHDLPRPISSTTQRLVMVLVALGIVANVSIFAVSLLVPLRGLRHPAIILSAEVAFAYWAAGVMSLILARNADPGIQHKRLRLFRFCWATGAVTFLVHVGMAFHFAHDWSHSSAFQHVEASSGFGPGLFLSYLFAIVWTVDAIWLVAASGSYHRRSSTLNWGIQAFLTFLFFQATVLYGFWPLDTIAAFVFGLLTIRWVKSRANRRTDGIASPPDSAHRSPHR